MTPLERRQIAASDRLEWMARNASVNAGGVDFWKLIPKIELGACLTAYAFMWSVAALPVWQSLSPLALRYGKGWLVEPVWRVAYAVVPFARHSLAWMDVRAFIALVIEWTALFGLGLIIALVPIFWQAHLEAASPTGRRGYVWRALKIGVAYGLAQAAAFGPVLWAIAGLSFRLAFYPLVFLVMALLAGYVSARIDAKKVPIEY